MPAPQSSADPASSAAPAAPEAAPVVATAPPAEPAQPVEAAAPQDGTDLGLALGGGALALLALSGAAVAVTRRRREDESDWAEAEAIEQEPAGALAEEPAPAPAPTPRHDPIVGERPAILAPPVSAFAWGETRRQEPLVLDAPVSRLAGESWVERAYRGPSPENPSLSLRKRLKRAAFFDQRERGAAAGRSPVDFSAGLPERAAADVRELETV